MVRYVIIGSSAGAAGAVEGIRKLDPSSEVVVISEEAESSYCRPLLGEYLERTVNVSSPFLGQLDFWEANGVTKRIGTRVVSVNVHDRCITLDDGEVLAFDRLLLATGARPTVPKMAGTEKKGFHTFASLEDIRSIQGRLPEAHRIVVIGGGLIGVAAAEALTNLGLCVTIVEFRERLLSLLLDKEASTVMEQAMRRRGVRILTGLSVKKILGKEGIISEVDGVMLSNEERLDCDLVIAAIGVTPRTELALQAGIKVNRGILVNRFMETSAPGIFACGDAAEAYEFLNGENKVLALWPLARLGGRVAGFNIAGSSIEYPGGFPMSALRYFDVPIISAGLCGEETLESCEATIYRGPSVYRKIVLCEEKVVGFTLVGDLGGAGVYYSLLRSRTKVSDLKARLPNPDFGFLHLPESVRRRISAEAWA